MGICTSSTQNREQDRIQNELSRKIDMEINKEKKAVNRKIKILLLGIGESGKSTITRQFENYSSDDLLTYTNYIHDFIIIGINIILSIVLSSHDSNEKKVEIGLLELMKDIKDMISNRVDSSRILSVRSREILVLWASEYFTDIFSNRHLYNINDNLDYFLDVKNFRRIIQSDYKPTLDDYLHVRIRTTGIHETKYIHQKEKVDYEFSLIDVGGQKGERRKWIQCFSDINAVVYCASLCDYNMTLSENGETNRLQESLAVFEQIKKTVGDIPIILFLNKTDIFRNKITKFPLSIHLKKCHRLADQPIRDDFQSSCDYIRDIYLSGLSKQDNITYYYTCATNTDQIKNIVDSIFDSILGKILDNIGI